MVRNMRRKNNEEIEKMETMLKSVKPPELTDEEIESYKGDFNKILQEEFVKVTLQRERRHLLRVKLAYGIGIFVLLVSILSFVYTKPYFVKLATAKIIENKLQYKVALKDVIVKDGVGIVIYNDQEVIVNVSSGSIEFSQPIKYEPSDKEKEEAIEIVRNSKEAKYFVAKEGEAPQDISKNDVVSVEGLMFPSSGKKLVEVRLAYTPTSYQDLPPLHSIPGGSQPPLTTAKFTVDIEKGKIQP
jgi:hypothetical protein